MYDIFQISSLDHKQKTRYFQRIVKKSGYQHVSTHLLERMKRLPSWLKIKKESPYTEKKNKRDDMQRMYESSPKRAINADGNYFYFRKVAG